MKNIFTIALAGVIAFSCTTDSETITTQSGIEVTLHTKGTDEINPGMMMILDFNVKTATDSVIMDTSVDGMPRPARKVDSLTVRTQGGIEEVIFNLKKGDSVYFQIPAAKIYGPRGTPPQLKADELLKVNMVVRDAMNQEEFQSYSQKMMEEKSKEQLEKDIKTIDDYLAENNIETEKTESGLRYIITRTGEGENVQSGQTIKANYSGYVLNGEYFDSSVEEIAKEKGLYQEGRSYGPFETVIGQGAVIKGWDEGFQLMNAGSKATLYIPSPLAYGSRARSKQIGPNSILVFDVELVEIK